MQRTIWQNEPRDLAEAKRHGNSTLSTFWFWESFDARGTTPRRCCDMREYEIRKLEEQILDRTNDEELISLIDELKEKVGIQRYTDGLHNGYEQNYQTE